MQGRLKSITLQSSQEAWKLDFPEIAAAAAPGGHGHPDAPTHQVPISTSNITPRATGHKKNKRGASTSENIQENDDDDFMPPTKQHASTRTSSSMLRTNIRSTFGASSSSKLPCVRCMPSVFIKLTDHLNMNQRRKISELGFGGLLLFSAEGLDTSELLVYLMDKLNPDSMILEVGNEGGLKINELCVRKIFGVPKGDRDSPSSTEDENALALVEFRKVSRAEHNKELNCNHLLGLVRKLNIGNALAVRIFFVVAFNKLLFPALDKNIRGQDAFLTKDLIEFGNINWCKAVINDLRHAAISWRSEKKKSILGCGIFLIIFYLDNLDSANSIAHFSTPRAKYFHKGVIEKIIREDKRIDISGKVTYGNLQLKNIANTCYQYTEQQHSGFSASANHSLFPLIPPAEEVGVLINNISSSTSRQMAQDGIQHFMSKATQAISSIQSGSNMLIDARKDFIHTMRTLLVKDPLEKTTTDQDTRGKGPACEAQRRTNEALSSPHYGVQCTEETIPHCQSSTSHMIGTRPRLVPTTHVPVAQEGTEMNVQGEQYNNDNIHRVVSSHGQVEEERSAPCIAHADQHISWESFVNSTAFRMAPDIGTFAPDLDKIIEDINAVENKANDSINNDNMDSVHSINENLPEVSIDHIIPAVTVEGCLDPNAPNHDMNLILESSSIHVEKKFDTNNCTVGEAPTPIILESGTCNQVEAGTGDASLRNATLDVLQYAPSITAATPSYINDDLYDRISTFASTQDDSGYCIQARPRIDRLVNVPTRYRSPFKCITPRAPIDMTKAHAVRSKICIELKDKRRLVIHAPDNWLTCKDVARTFADGADAQPR